MLFDIDDGVTAFLDNVWHKSSAQSCKSCIGCEQISGCNRPGQDSTEDRFKQLPCVYTPPNCLCLTITETDTAACSHVFLGRALEKLDHNDDSEEAYKVAVGTKKTDALAWQGLVGLYEKQAGRKLDDYHDAAVRLAEIHMEKYVEQQFPYLAWWEVWTNRVVTVMTRYVVSLSYTSTQRMPKSTVLERNTNILWRFYYQPLLCMTISKVEFPNLLSHTPGLQTS